MGIQYRNVLPGQSDLAHAWTDGKATIWVETRQFSLLTKGYRGCARMAALLAHEYLHSGPDTETHDHDGEFYERFHNAVIDTDLIGRAADSMLAYMASIARKDGRSPSKAILKFEDLHEALERVGGKPNGPLISESEAAEMKALAALESDSQIDDDEDKAQAA